MKLCCNDKIRPGREHIKKEAALLGRPLSVYYH